jgi:hypothetical protein
MFVNEYRYALLLYREDGSSIGTAPVTVDWGPATECARFDHARRGIVPLGEEGAASIEPLWHRTEGEPLMRGFRVAFNGAGKRVTSDYPTSYFTEAATHASSEFVRQGKLAAGDKYLFQAVALAGNGNGRPAAGVALEVVEEKPDLPLIESRLDDFRRRSTPAGTVDGGIDADDMPVFVPRRVLEEVAELTRGATGRETGGILIGHLHTDPSLPEIFLEATAQIPAEHTLGTVDKLTFTAETWSAASAAIRLRNRGEIYCGYFHSHPVGEWCKARGCSPEQQKSCRLAKDFFSEDDVAVMRAAFPRGYSIGLVANDAAYLDLSFSMFGWREGKILPRGFYVLEEESNA